MRTLSGAFVLAVMAVSQSHPAVQRPTIDELMQRVGRYVADWGERATFLVCVETYDQRTTRAPIGQPSGRQLKSEFALVGTGAGAGWAGYRDVFEVDGKVVSDRRDRLVSLFRAEVPDLAEARSIADESARYNIGVIRRNFNVPTAALFFFTPDGLKHFTFKRRGQESVDGVGVTEVAFTETVRPTFIRTAAGKNTPAQGSLWVVENTGVVVRTWLVISGFGNNTTSADIDVTYKRDARLSMWVPAVMREHYRGRMAVRSTMTATQMGETAVDNVETLGTANYSDYRRFETGARVVK